MDLKKLEKMLPGFLLMIFKTLRPTQPVIIIGAVVLSKQFFTLQESENERLRLTWRGLVIAKTVDCWQGAVGPATT